jgi:hypothetical protein
MPRRRNPDPPASPWDSETRLLSWLAMVAAILSFLFYFRNGEVMLYGDAIAHINIARRVFDSKTPGLLQLGTVWLPLPHLLIIPFIVSMRMWQTGAGGSIPSMTGYVFAVIGIFRLTRSSLSRGAVPDTATKAAGWVAAFVLGANPNLIYMQSTAMGESLYLAFFIWAVVFFIESARDPKALTKCGLCLAAACLTRYDGWFLAAAMAGVVLLQVIFFAKKPERANSRKGVVKFLLIAAAAPALWFAYNGIIYRNPLEFENGPYSAKAIEKRSQSASNPGHPGSGSLRVSGLYFFKAAQETWAGNEDLQRAAVIWFVFGCVAGVIVLRRFAGPLLFLLLPVPFYALSIAYGGVPIFIPHWWPFSHYNTRYGLQLLPAFAFGVAMIFYLAVRPGFSTRGLITVYRWISIAGCIVLVVGAYASVWRSGPITLREAQLNMRTRNQLQTDLATWIEKLPPNATLLMYLGDQVGALERAGFPLSHTINEGNHRVWMQPADPAGVWERALADPSKYANYVLALDGDPVWQAVHNLHLPEVVEIHVSGQPRAILYRAR